MRARLSICALVACGLIAAPSAAAAGCPNEALREAQGATALPGCMALEMVSPPKKFSQLAFAPSFSYDGERILYIAQAALAGTPRYQNFLGDRYVATRSAGGWQTQATSPPASASLAFGGPRGGGPSAFTADLGHWNLLGATQVQNQVGVFRLFGGGLDGSFEALSPQMVPVDESGSRQIQSSVPAVDLSGSSADVRTSVLRGDSSLISYLPGDPKLPPGLLSDEPGGDRKNSYVTSVQGGIPTVELLARDRDGPVYGGRCGAHLGGPFNIGAHPTSIQGALSPFGERIFLSTRPAQPFDPETAEGPACDTDNPIRVMVRTATDAGPEIEPLLPGGPADWTQPGDDLLEAASADGTRAYIATPRKLTGSDNDAGAQPCVGDLGASKGCDLYLYDSQKAPGARLTLVSDGAAPGQSADVLSTIAAVSGDGSRAYFVAQGALTLDPNPEGASSVPGQPNLYAYDAATNQLAFIGTLAPDDAGGLWAARGSLMGDAFAAPYYGPGGPEGETGGDGHLLVFASKAALSADDTDGGRRDVFRYDDAADSLERISKAAPAGSDNGPFDAAVNPNVSKSTGSNFGEQSRWVSEDGQDIAFMTAERLLPGDEDEAANPYAWLGGQLARAGAAIEAPPAMAVDGTQFAFATQTTLLPQDIDTSEDVYLARVGGGFAIPVPPTRCDPLSEGSCQGASPPLQAPPAPTTASFTGPGNRAQPSACRKPRVKRRGRCVKKPRKGKRNANKRGANR